MDKDKKAGTKNAFDLFPNLMDQFHSPTTGKVREEEEAPASKAVKKDLPPSARTLTAPPKPPDISWLREGIFEEKTQRLDVPTALILVPEGESSARITQSCQELGYQTETADSPDSALKKMQVFDFASVVLHTGFEKGPLAASKVHNHIKWLPMAKRRYIYYVIVGPQLNTLYDLEALSLSANLVVNERHVQYMNVILQKGLQDHDLLFGPLLEILKSAGKL